MTGEERKEWRYYRNEYKVQSKGKGRKWKRRETRKKKVGRRNRKKGNEMKRRGNEKGEGERVSKMEEKDKEKGVEG